jgi:hypothetical protein
MPLARTSLWALTATFTALCCSCGEHSSAANGGFRQQVQAARDPVEAFDTLADRIVDADTSSAFALVDSFLLKKDRFETTAEYQARAAKLLTNQAYLTHLKLLTNRAYLIHLDAAQYPLRDCGIVPGYDADHEIFSATPSRDFLAIPEPAVSLICRDSSVGNYQLTNGVGATVKGTRIRVTRFSATKTASGERNSLPKPGLNCLIARDSAKAMHTRLRYYLEVRPTPGGDSSIVLDKTVNVEPTIRSPNEMRGHDYILRASRLTFFVVDGATGRIVCKAPL